MAAAKWQPARLFGDLHMILIALPTISRASPILLEYLAADASRRSNERKDVRRSDGVEFLVADHNQPIADHAVERLAGVHQLALELHGFTLKAAPDRLLHG